MDCEATIKQLVAENAQLRETLRHSPDREIQLAAAVALVVDEVTRLGPGAAARIFNYAFARYGCDHAMYAHNFRDRREKKVVTEKPPTPVPALPHQGAELRARRTAAGLSQVALAKRAGVKQPVISMIELGRIKGVPADWEKIERVLK